MNRQRVINNSLQPQMLESGVQLAAAGTPGSERTDVSLNAVDRARLVETGVVSVIETRAKEAVVPQAEPTAEQPPARRAPARRHD